jgi:putative MATE family efflux protein
MSRAVIPEPTDVSSPSSVLAARVGPASQRILSGPLALEVARFGVPLALGMGLQTSFNLVDAYIISGLGGQKASAALGAIGVADLIGALGTILSYGLSIATSAIISRKQGEGDMEGVRRVAWQSVLLLVGVSALVSCFGIFGAEALMVGLAGAKGEVARVGTEFLRVMMGGSFTIFLLLHLITIQRALGSSKTPIVLLVIANLANLVLAVLFVYGPGPAPDPFGWGPPLAERLGIPRMELVGAAWATVIARCFGLVPIFYISFRRFGLFSAQDRLAPSLAHMRRIWNIGWPTSSQLVVRVLAIFVIVAVAQRLYTTAEDQSMSTALGLVLRLETMALYVGLGWGSAAQTFVGQNLGAVQRVRAKQSGWYATLYNAVMMAAFAGACRLWGRQFVMLFDSTPSVVDAAMHYLAIVAPGYVGLGIGIVLGSAIQGAGATRQSLRLDTLVIVGIQVPLCAAAYFMRWEATSLWTAVLATYLAFALTYVFSYRQGAFLKYDIG